MWNLHSLTCPLGRPLMIMRAREGEQTSLFGNHICPLPIQHHPFHPPTLGYLMNPLKKGSKICSPELTLLFLDISFDLDKNSYPWALQPRWTNRHHDVLGSLKECAFNPHDPLDSPSSASQHYQAKNVLSLPNVDCALFSWRCWPCSPMSSEERPKRPWNMSNMWKRRQTSYYKLRQCIPKVHRSSRVWRSLPICRPTSYLHHLLMELNITLL